MSAYLWRGKANSRLQSAGTLACMRLKALSRDTYTGNLSEEDYLRWKAEYDPAGAQKRIKSGGTNSHFDWKKAKMSEERFEEELAKLPIENNKERLGERASSKH